MRHFQMIFKDKQLLDEMLDMRRRGWTYKSLGIIFKVDHSSIYKACKIRNVRPLGQPISINISDIVQMLFPKHIVLLSKEKTYKDYLIEDKYRKYPNLKRLMTSV